MPPAIIIAGGIFVQNFLFYTWFSLNFYVKGFQPVTNLASWSCSNTPLYGTNYLTVIAPFTGLLVYRVNPVGVTSQAALCLTDRHFFRDAE